ncbi:probable polygalacturonase non-catalytic subunit jp630 [Phtheirospermum japonicum]|uniref:Probable polygalacturonase non-catalytic subunit jp630 n=1 Tax=Phtheirospermum japonicum TaxID=374723 RepID=A0A830BKL3_9LAMI|nr:probable polygalacturonase non-catalytic subunit jp630 [Phtheirospermum japonicum]
MDPNSFFRVSIFKEGNTIRLPNLKESLPHRAFIPPQIASKISLSKKGAITKIFPASAKDAIDTTLSYCNAASIKGELKACPKSLEEMISFSKTALGTKKLLSLSSESTTGSGQELTIKKVKKFDVEKIVACHEMFLPFATYFCHSLPSSRIYSVDFVEPRTKAPVNTVMAICHMDTSPWPANHVAFEILKFGPGQGEACHWLNQIDLAWIAAGGENI